MSRNEQLLSTQSNSNLVVKLQKGEICNTLLTVFILKTEKFQSKTTYVKTDFFQTAKTMTAIIRISYFVLNRANETASK